MEELPVIGRPLIRFDRVSSTMDVARALLANGAKAGTVVQAGYQTAGRGRASRAWTTPPWSAVLLSFLTASQRPAHELGVLSLLWGWAVAETVDAFAGQGATIKWPNDVLVGGQKIAGILTTNSMGPMGQAQVTGIGLNVSMAAADLPPTGTSLALVCGAAPPLDLVLENLLLHLNQALVFVNDASTDHLATLVEPRLAFRGEEVTVQDGDRVALGTLEGVDLDGALRLMRPDGRFARIVAGDLTRGPRRPV
jgi:BirA family biotin operon repressor/biotin-[acetyl-CoA-carboxylase] ligase